MGVVREVFVLGAPSQREAIKKLFDEWAMFTQDGNMSDEQYWHTPRWHLEQYRAALVRRSDRIEARMKEERNHG